MRIDFKAGVHIGVFLGVSDKLIFQFGGRWVLPFSDRLEEISHA